MEVQLGKAMQDFYHLDPVCSRNKYTLEGIGKPWRQSLSWLNEKERILQKSCSVFIEYAQAVAWRQSQTQAKSWSHS